MGGLNLNAIDEILKTLYVPTLKGMFAFQLEYKSIEDWIVGKGTFKADGV